MTDAEFRMCGAKMDKRANVLLALSKCIEEPGCLNDPECPYVPQCFGPGRHAWLPIELLEDIRTLLKAEPKTAPDREKVIRSLENCVALPKCRDCPREECENPDDRKSEYPDNLIRQALELLKGDDANNGKDD